MAAKKIVGKKTKKAVTKKKAPAKKEVAKKSTSTKLIVITGVSPRMKRDIARRAESLYLTPTAYVRMVLANHINNEDPLTDKG